MKLLLILVVLSGLIFVFTFRSRSRPLQADAGAKGGGVLALVSIVALRFVRALLALAFVVGALLAIRKFVSYGLGLSLLDEGNESWLSNVPLRTVGVCIVLYALFKVSSWIRKVVHRMDARRSPTGMPSIKSDRYF